MSWARFIKLVSQWEVIWLIIGPIMTLSSGVHNKTPYCISNFSLYVAVTEGVFQIPKHIWWMKQSKTASDRTATSGVWFSGSAAESFTLHYFQRFTGDSNVKPELRLPDLSLNTWTSYKTRNTQANVCAELNVRMLLIVFYNGSCVCCCL